MEDLYAQIAIIENWLRDHPHADREARWEMTSRLREINEKLNKLKDNQEYGNNSNEQTSARTY